MDDLVMKFFGRRISYECRGQWSPRRLVFCCSVLLAVFLIYSRTARADADLETLTAEGRTLLDSIEDNTFNFDHEGFYWYCTFLKETPEVFSESECGSEPTPWQFLMERPSDYRGRTICIEGFILDVKPVFRVSQRPELGNLYQLEIGQPGSNAVATVILVEEPKTSKFRTEVRLPCFFIKSRAFRSVSGNESGGPVVVGRNLKIIAAPSGTAFASKGRIDISRLLILLAGGTMMLAIVFAVLRRSLAGRTETVATSKPTTNTDISGTTADFDWMDDDED